MSVSIPGVAGIAQAVTSGLGAAGRRPPSIRQTAEQNCLVGTLAPARAKAIEEAAIEIVGIGPVSNLGGSATIVANSGGSGKINRMLSASHVIDADPHAVNYLAYASDGTLIGNVGIVARVADWGAGARWNDQTVLEITHFASDEAKQRYRSREGLPLARTQDSSGYEYGIVRPGLMGNGSGGALIAGNGEIAGTIVAGLNGFNQRPPLTSVTGMEFRGGQTNRIVQPVDRHPEPLTISIDGWSTTFARSVTDPRILEALNEAGRGIKVAPTPPREMTIVGYPEGICMADISGRMRSLNVNDLRSFDGLTTPHPAGEFARWDDPKEAMKHVKSLIGTAEAEIAGETGAHPSDGGTMRQVRHETKLSADTDMAVMNAIAQWMHRLAQAEGAMENPDMQARLEDAVNHTDGFALQKQFRGLPKPQGRSTPSGGLRPESP